MAQTMAEYLIQQGKEEGKEEGEKRGKRSGKIEAKRETLLRLLELRFNAVPEPIINKVSAIRSLSRLDSLFEQAFAAQTLDEIDWDNA